MRVEEHHEAFLADAAEQVFISLAVGMCVGSQITCRQDYGASATNTVKHELSRNEKINSLSVRTFCCFLQSLFDLLPGSQSENRSRLEDCCNIFCRDLVQLTTFKKPVTWNEATGHVYNLVGYRLTCRV
jgi:hypothetical protein